MAKVILTAPFSTEFFGGKTELDVAAGNLFALVRALDGLAPGFAEAAETRAGVAVDGAVVSNWATALTPHSEVLFVLRIAGG